MSIYPDSGKRVREFFEAEANSLLNSYLYVQTLIPAANRKGAAHVAEEGRHIESLLRSFLNKHLPKELQAFSGFILRPATKTQLANKNRIKDGDEHSSQLDIIVFDVANYPIYERFEEFAIVPPEGVIAVISVKKNLYKQQIENELWALSEAVKLCRHQTKDPNIWTRSPNSALITFSSSEKLEEDNSELVKNIFESIEENSKNLPFDQLVNQVTILDRLSLFKSRPNPPDENIKSARYIWAKHGKQDFHWGLQFLLSGILSVYYDETRSTKSRPGFTSFPSGKGLPTVGKIEVNGLRCRD